MLSRRHQPTHASMEQMLNEGEEEGYGKPWTAPFVRIIYFIINFTTFSQYCGKATGFIV